MARNEVDNPPTINQSVREFFSGTSAHGFGKISSSQGPRRYLWTVLTLGAFSGFTFHLISLTISYLNYPKSLQHEIIENRFIFPEITFCPTYSFSASRSRELDDFEKHLEHAWMLVNRVDKYLDNVSYLTKLSMRSIIYYWDVFKYPQDHIIDCKFRNEKCDFRNFTVFKHPTKFICFRFTPDNRTLRSKGPQGGLKLMLNFYGAREYKTDAETIETLDGYEFNIHPIKTRPSFASDILISQIGSHLSVGLEMHVKEKLNLNRDSCEPKEDEWTMATDLTSATHDNVTFTYTAADCHVISRQQNMIERCGCLDDQFAVPIDIGTGRYKFCHHVDEELIQMMAAIPSIDNLTLSQILQMKKIVKMAEAAACYQEESEYFIESANLPNICPLSPCKKIDYPRRSQTTRWPTNITSIKAVEDKIIAVANLAKELGLPLDKGMSIFASEDNDLLDDIVEEQKYVPFSYVNIYATSLSLDQRKEILVLPFPEFIAAVGGTFGLWIGFSVITMCEFLDLLFLVLVKGFYSHRRQFKMSMTRKVTNKKHTSEDI